MPITNGCTQSKALKPAAAYGRMYSVYSTVCCTCSLQFHQRHFSSVGTLPTKTPTFIILYDISRSLRIVQSKLKLVIEKTHSKQAIYNYFFFFSNSFIPDFQNSGNLDFATKSSSKNFIFQLFCGLIFLCRSKTKL